MHSVHSHYLLHIHAFVFCLVIHWVKSKGCLCDHGFQTIIQPWWAHLWVHKKRQWLSLPQIPLVSSSTAECRYGSVSLFDSCLTDDSSVLRSPSVGNHNCYEIRIAVAVSFSEYSVWSLSPCLLGTLTFFPPPLLLCFLSLRLDSIGVLLCVGTQLWLLSTLSSHEALYSLGYCKGTLL